jgi:hypothetical protein
MKDLEADSYDEPGDALAQRVVKNQSGNSRPSDFGNGAMHHDSRSFVPAILKCVWCVHEGQFCPTPT